MRAERSIGSFLTGVGCYAVVLVTGMVASPFLIRWLGSSVYGEYRLLLDWVGYLALLDLALPDTMFPLLAVPIGKGEAREARDALVSGVRAFTKLLPLKLLGGVILVAVISHLIPGASDTGRTIRLACAIGAAGSLLGFLLPFRTLIEVQQRSYIVNILVAFQAVLTAVLALAFAHLQYGLLGQAVAFFLGSIPFLVFVTVTAARAYPGLAGHLFRGDVRAETTQALWKLNRPNVIGAICARLSVMTDNIIVGLLMNPTSVTSFALTQRLIAAAQGQLYSIGNSSWAGMADLAGKGEHQNFRNKALELTSLITTFGMIILAPIAAFNPHFVSLWVGHAQYAGDAVTLLACGDAVALALTSLWSWNFAALGLNHLLVPQYIASTVLNVIVSVAATKLLGLPGPLLGTFLANLATGLWIIPRKMQERFSVRTRDLYLATLRPIAILAPSAAAFWFFARHSTPPGWAGLVVELTAGACVQGGLAWALVLTKESRWLWSNRAQRFVNVTFAGVRR